MGEKPKSKDDLNDLLSTRAFFGIPLSGPYIPPTYELRYKCTKCGHEWDDIHVGDDPVEDSQDCRMGCSKGYGEFSLLGLYRELKGLITGKEPFGLGRLIGSKKVQ